MLALYICAGTGLVVWLWLVFDMTREARARRDAKGPAPARALAPEGPEEGSEAPQEQKPSPKQRAQIKGAKRAKRPARAKGGTRPKVTMNRPKRRPAKPEPEPEPEPQPPPKPKRDPREWTDEDYD